MNSNKITSCTDPTSAQDVATKNYVDGRTLAQILTTSNVASAKITSVTDPTAAQDAATKNYVDGRTLAQILTVSNVASAKITSVTDPTAAQDAATKNYVDGRPARVLYTAQGQIQYAGVGPTYTPTNLSVGANGNVLTLAGGIPSWAVPSSVSVATAKCAAFACGFVGDVAIENLTPPVAGPSSVVSIPFSTVLQTASNDASITFAIDANGRLQYTGTGSVVVNVFANINWATQQTQSIFPFPSGPFIPVDFVTNSGVLTNASVFTILSDPINPNTYARCSTGANNYFSTGAYTSNLSGTFVMNQNDIAGLNGYTNSIFNFSGLPGQYRFLFTNTPTIYPISDFSFTAFRLSS